MSVVGIPADSLKRLCLELLSVRGVRSDVAHHVSSGLIQASLRGVDSHGVRLLPHYMRGLEAGRLNPTPAYSFQQTAPATGHLDGDHTFGHAAGAEGMGRAIDLARESGLGAVTVYNSSHFGAAAYFALMAAEQEMVGLSFTHADSLMLTHGSTRAYFGTNPICFAAPCSGEGPFCLDMATTSVTWNKLLQVSSDGGDIPQGWGVDGEGNDTQDPQLIKALHPIGAYKGFGLAMMVDVLCGLLTGMPFGRDISHMYKGSIQDKRYLGHFFMALRVDSFVPLESFKSRMREMMDQVRSEPPQDASVAVQVAGDPQKESEEERRQSGIPLSLVELEELRSLANQNKVDFPEIE